MTKVGPLKSVAPVDGATPSAPRANPLLLPEVIRQGPVTPVVGGGFAALRAQTGLHFRDHVVAADRKIAEGANGTTEAVRLVELARAHLDKNGVTYEHVVTYEGFDALRILPNHDGGLLGSAAANADELDGFWFLYSPAKLITHQTRGDNWRYRRELFMSHDAIDELRLDPITIHEMEHAILSRAEEKGIPQLFTGNVAGKEDKSISAARPEVGGYCGLLSFQEISAYAIQCEMLAERIADPQTTPEDLERYVDELCRMALWGAALSERITDVAKQSLDRVTQSTDGVAFERFALTIDARGRICDAGPPLLWAKITDLPNCTPQVPLPHATEADDPTKQALLVTHFDRLSDATTALTKHFDAIHTAAGAAQANPPVTRAQADKLAVLTRAMFSAKTTLAGTYRADHET